MEQIHRVPEATFWLQINKESIIWQCNNDLFNISRPKSMRSVGIMPFFATELGKNSHLYFFICFWGSQTGRIYQFKMDWKHRCTSLGIELCLSGPKRGHKVTISLSSGRQNGKNLELTLFFFFLAHKKAKEIFLRLCFMMSLDLSSTCQNFFFFLTL